VIIAFFSARVGSAMSALKFWLRTKVGSLSFVCAMSDKINQDRDSSRQTSDRTFSARVGCVRILAETKVR
jgi:hypothetical protein